MTLNHAWSRARLLKTVGVWASLPLLVVASVVGCSGAEDDAGSSTSDLSRGHDAGTSALTLPRVLMKTSLGEIEIEVDIERAPITGAHFLSVVQKGFYNSGDFHRTVTNDNQPGNPVKIQVIQAATDPAKPAVKTIPLERTSITGIHHLSGTISMARAAPTDSAAGEFFLCIGDQPELDFGGRRNPDGQGFAAFGHITKGASVVLAIQKSPADGQNLTPPIVIQSAVIEGVNANEEFTDPADTLTVPDVDGGSADASIGD